MTKQTRRPGLWSAPGDGVLARSGDLILLTGAAEAELLDRLLAALEQVAAAGGGGRRLADAVEDVLGDAARPPVIALGPSGAGLVVLMAGAAWTDITTEAGTEALPGGRPGWLVRSTLPGPVLAVHAGLDAGQRGAARTDRYSHLDSGSVRAGSLSYYASPPAAEAWPQPAAVPAARHAPEPAAPGRPVPAAEAAEASEASEAPQPDVPGAAAGRAAADRGTEGLPAPPAPDGGTDGLPAPPAAPRRTPGERRALGAGRSSDVYQPEDDQPPAASQPASGQASASPSPAAGRAGMSGPAGVRPSPAAGRAGTSPSPAAGPASGAGEAPAAAPEPAARKPFDAVLLTGESLSEALSESLSEAGDRPPLPPAAEPAVAGPSAAAEPMIMGAYCKNGHFDDPEARFCAVCGISMNQQTLTPRLGPRPPLGLLLLDTGAVLQLDTDYVIGREPELDPSVVSGDARPLSIPDGTGTLSRVHAQIQLVDWNVLLTDLGSANGTRVRPPGDSVAEQLTPRVPVVLRPGSRVDLGGRRLHYESHRGR